MARTSLLASPAAVQIQVADVEDAPLPDGWFRFLTDAGIPYYAHSVTNETRWDPPTR